MVFEQRSAPPEPGGPPPPEPVGPPPPEPGGTPPGKETFCRIDLYRSVEAWRGAGSWLASGSRGVPLRTLAAVACVLVGPARARASLAGSRAPAPASGPCAPVFPSLAPSPLRQWRKCRGVPDRL